MVDETNVKMSISKGIYDEAKRRGMDIDKEIKEKKILVRGKIDDGS